MVQEWGTLVLAISSTFPEHQVTGIERSPIPYLYSLIITKLLGRNNCHLLYMDLFKTSLNDTDIVVCYLCTSLMQRLKEKLEKELINGALVISNTFAIPGWEPIESITANDFFRSKIYVYRKGAYSLSSNR